MSTATSPVDAAYQRSGIIAVCLENHPNAVTLLRTARTRAKNAGCRWCAIFIETPNTTTYEAKDDNVQEQMLRLLTIAEQMGAETAFLEAENTEQGIVKFLKSKKAPVTLLIMGSVEQTGTFRWLHPSPWNRIAKIARQWDTAVEIIPLPSDQESRGFTERLRASKPHHYGYALLAVSVAYISARLLEWALPPALFRINDQNVALLFMIACAFAAGRYGLLPGLLASAASFLTVNYFFTVPYDALKLSSITDLLNMGLFLSAALLISLFTSQTHFYAQKAAKRELSTQALFTLYRIASNAFSRPQALEKLSRKLEQMLQVDVAFFMPPILHPDRIEVAYPHKLTLEKAEWGALELCWQEMKTTGLGSPHRPEASWRFEPMMTSSGEIGVLGIRPRPGTQLDSWFSKLLAAIANQTAAVLERMELERSMEATRLREEREKLRSLLLSSVSHDLKTPLAAISGALGVYRSQGKQLVPKQREELINTALAETERLDRFITNILDMTRLESGKIEFRQEWHDMESILRRVVKRLEHRLQRHSLLVHPSPPGIEIYMDSMMTEQVLQNLLDNACNYTVPGTMIEIRTTAQDGQGFRCEVRDHGKGLPDGAQHRIFDKYARLQKKDSQVAGTGLGLAISKAVIEAQGGRITASNHPDGGAVFTFVLPQWRLTETVKYSA